MRGDWSCCIYMEAGWVAEGRLISDQTEPMVISRNTTFGRPYEQLRTKASFSSICAEYCVVIVFPDAQNSFAMHTCDVKDVPKCPLH